jgi:hypothetical protein
VIQIKKQQVENLTNTIQKWAEVVSELKENTNVLLEFSGSSQIQKGDVQSMNSGSIQNMNSGTIVDTTTSVLPQ